MTGQTRLFLYGTLLDPDLFGVVGACGPLTGDEATLSDHAVYWVEGKDFPVIVANAGGSTQGLVVTLTPEARARLDFYEVGFGYHLTAHVVETASGAEEVLVYFPETEGRPSGAPWSLTEWQAAHGVLARAAASDYMRLFGDRPPEIASASFPQIKARAASRLRAGGAPSPIGFGAPVMRAAEVVETGHPYTAYFGVREDKLSVPGFSGAMGPVVQRASWLGADAVTVLPYDPVADTVLVVRQWRHGPFCRGDSNPWTVEPPAGRIDPGETPEEAARRELVEETGVEVGALFKVAGYYPTPGAFSEHLTSYVALADLSGRDGTVSGLETEDEDIMSHVLAVDALPDLIEAGAINTGPLILSIQWLMLNRERLRAI